MTVSPVKSGMKNELLSGVKGSYLSRPFMGREGGKSVYAQGGQRFSHATWLY